MAKRASKAIAKEALWLVGDLTYLLHPAQLDIYNKFKATDGKRFIVCSGRQIGKSYFLCVMAIQEALRNPNSQIKFVAPTRSMVKSIVFPHIKQICKDAPASSRPEYYAQNNQYVFPNGSTISIAGTDSGNVERLRGTKADLCIVDEAAFIADLKYCISDVLMPMTITTSGRILIASTPPTVPRHMFQEYWDAAVITGNCIHKTIYDNPMISKKELQDFIDDCGGEDTNTWKREYLGEFAFDLNSLVIPEFTKELQNKVIQEIERPAHYDAYVAVDPGYTDLTAVIFGYWDFAHSRLVIEDEVSMDQIRTDLLASAIKEKEAALWGKKKPYFRLSDAEPILLRDLDELHGLQFVTTDRDDKRAAINEVRLMLQAEKIIIHPRCRNLIAHLASASWEPGKDKFTRQKGLGHFDFVDSLSYLVRNIRKNHNPFPPDHYSSTHMHVNFQPSQQSGSARILSQLFKPKKFSS